MLSKRLMIVYDNQRHMPAELKDIITVVNSKGGKPAGKSEPRGGDQGQDQE